MKACHKTSHAMRLGDGAENELGFALRTSQSGQSCEANNKPHLLPLVLSKRTH